MIAYLDNAATTAVLPEVAQAACSAMLEDYYNPSSRYPDAKRCAKALDSHRATIAHALGCQPKELFFTSCGSESDNWAIHAAIELNRRKGNHIITTALEHSAVLEPIKKLEKQGYEVTYLSPNPDGSISLSEFEAALREDTILVSAMLVNNELGTILPIAEMTQILKRSGSSALFHCDAVQAFLKVPFTPKKLGVDLLSVSGHKVHAPKGIGALYIRNGLKLPAFILGGGQESGLRSGTEATSQIAAFAKACEIGSKHMSESIEHMENLKAYLLDRISEELPGIKPIVPVSAPHIVALTMSGYKSEVLVRVLGDKGVYVSAGSACHRGKPSHVYAAMPLSKADRDGAFRVSFTGESTKEDVDALISALKESAETLFPSMS